LFTVIVNNASASILGVYEPNNKAWAFAYNCTATYDISLLEPAVQAVKSLGFSDARGSSTSFFQDGYELTSGYVVVVSAYDKDGNIEEIGMGADESSSAAAKRKAISGMWNNNAPTINVEYSNSFSCSSGSITTQKRTTNGTAGTDGGGTDDDGSDDGGSDGGGTDVPPVKCGIPTEITVMRNGLEIDFQAETPLEITDTMRVRTYRSDPSCPYRSIKAGTDSDNFTIIEQISGAEGNWHEYSANEGKSFLFSFKAKEDLPVDERIQGEFIFSATGTEFNSVHPMSVYHKTDWLDIIGFQWSDFTGVHTGYLDYSVNNIDNILALYNKQDIPIDLKVEFPQNLGRNACRVSRSYSYELSIDTGSGRPLNVDANQFSNPSPTNWCTIYVKISAINNENLSPYTLMFTMGDWQERTVKHNDTLWFIHYEDSNDFKLINTNKILIGPYDIYPTHTDPLYNSAEHLIYGEKGQVSIDITKTNLVSLDVYNPIIQQRLLQEQFLSPYVENYQGPRAYIGVRTILVKGSSEDVDTDGDGTPDIRDAFPNNPLESLDTDKDGIGNVVDNDDDGDGYSDNVDVFPLDPLEWIDTDGDSIGDNSDETPYLPCGALSVISSNYLNGVPLFEVVEGEKLTINFERVTENATDIVQNCHRVGTIEFNYYLSPVDAYSEHELKRDLGDNPFLGTLTFTGDNTKNTIDFDISDNLNHQDNRLYKIEFSSNSNKSIKYPLIQLEIIEDEPVPAMGSEVYIKDASSGSLEKIMINEGEVIQIELVREGDASQDVVVELELEPIAGVSDYFTASLNKQIENFDSRIVIPAGDMVKRVNILTIDNDIAEYDFVKTNLAISSASKGYSVVNGGILEIQINDNEFSVGAEELGVELVDMYPENYVVDNHIIDTSLLGTPSWNPEWDAYAQSCLRDNFVYRNNVDEVINQPFFKFTLAAKEGGQAGYAEVFFETDNLIEGIDFTDFNASVEDIGIDILKIVDGKVFQPISSYDDLRSQFVPSLHTMLQKGVKLYYPAYPEKVTYAIATGDDVLEGTETFGLKIIASSESGNSEIVPTFNGINFNISTVCEIASDYYVPSDYEQETVIRTEIIVPNELNSLLPESSPDKHVKVKIYREANEIFDMSFYVRFAYAPLYQPSGTIDLPTQYQRTASVVTLNMAPGVNFVEGFLPTDRGYNDSLYSDKNKWALIEITPSGRHAEYVISASNSGLDYPFEYNGGRSPRGMKSIEVKNENGLFDIDVELQSVNENEVTLNLSKAVNAGYYLEHFNTQYDQPIAQYMIPESIPIYYEVSNQAGEVVYEGSFTPYNDRLGVDEVLEDTKVVIKNLYNIDEPLTLTQKSLSFSELVTQTNSYQLTFEPISFKFLGDPILDTDNDGVEDKYDTDDDNDGIPDITDQFPLDNTESADFDLDGIGNNTDTDDDNDGIPDITDQFPLDNTESADFDLDGIGNNTDTDDDGDGIEDSADAFPLDPSESIDTDSDGLGNNTDTDDDGDGIEDIADAFPLDSSESIDTDNDSLGNNTDTDDDGDGIEDSADASESIDTDSDGLGNNTDTDDDGDGDGVEDSADAFPLDASKSIATGNNENNVKSEDSSGGGSIYALLLFLFLIQRIKYHQISRKNNT
jgi:hypothetical protein